MQVLESLGEFFQRKRPALLRSGPRGVVFRGNLFCVSEISWLKSLRLTPLQWGMKVVLLVLGLVFMHAVAKAKGTYYNLECLLGLLPIHAAWLIQGENRLGSTGDFEDSYEERGNAPERVVRQWIEVLSTKYRGWLLLARNNYQYLINTERVAWARISWGVDYYPLVLAGVYWGYAWVINKGYDVSGTPVISDLNLLIYSSEGLGYLTTASYLVVGGLLCAFIMSFWYGVELTAPGGAHDTLKLCREDVARLLWGLAGYESGKSAPDPADTEKGSTSKPGGAASVIKMVFRLIKWNPLLLKRLRRRRLNTEQA